MEPCDEIQNDKKIPDENSKKRCFGMLDPDYHCTPDPKKLKQLEQEGQEELCSRVIRVVEKNFDDAILEGYKELEEIDSRIVQIRQLLHTLRYCVLLNFYSMDKTKKQMKGGFNEIHPNIQRHLGKASLSNGHETSSRNLALNKSITKTAKKINTASVMKSNPDIESSENMLTDKSSNGASKRNLTVAIKEPSEHNMLEANDLMESTKSKCTEIAKPLKNKDKTVSTISTSISQGRQSRFQSKKRVVVGNTYQYLIDEPSSKEHSLRFKWRIYVRGSQDEPDISSFVSSVTFTLDKSYSPHDIITIKQPPFVLSRRGWGEFKVLLKVSFHSPFDKPIQLLHSLTLGRTDDALAFTGIWRLGKETWYDIRVYDKWKKEPSSEKAQEGTKVYPPEDSKLLNHDASSETKSNVESFVKMGLNYSEMEGHVTISHSKSKRETSLIQTSETGNLPKKDKLLPISQNISNRPPIVNGENKLYKIHVRQSDGKLVPYFISSSMYNDALKLAEKAKTQQAVSEKCRDSTLTSHTLMRPTINGSTPQLSINNNLKSHLKFKKATIPSKSSANSSLRNPASNSQSSTIFQHTQQPLANGSNIVTPIPQAHKGLVVKFNPCSKNLPLTTNLSRGLTNSSTKDSNLVLSTSATTIGSNSIKLSTSILPVNTTKFIKTIGGKKFLIASPFLTGDKLPSDKKTIINGLFQNGKVVQPSKQNILSPSNTLGPMLGNKMAFAPILTPPSQANENHPIKVQPLSPTLNSLYIGKNASSAGSTTRRIFISAPPHLVKLKAESSENLLQPCNLPSPSLPSKIRPNFEAKNEVESLSEMKPWVAYGNRLCSLRDQSSKCRSVEEVLRLYMKGLPICQEADTSNLLCSATSSCEFLEWPIGKQKAIEFWRSRRIREQLKQLNLPGWKKWNSLRIVSWARRHCFSPFARKPHLLTEQHVRKVCLPQVHLDYPSFTICSDTQSSSIGKGKSVRIEKPSTLIEILVDDETTDNKSKGALNAKGVVEASEIIPLPDGLEGSLFVSSITTKLRMPLQLEPIEQGVEMDLTKAVLWKATLSFMEDLLRSSHSVAHTSLAESNLSKAVPENLTAPIHDSYVTPPSLIEVGHVKAGLVHGRPEFQMFTNFGLGKTVLDTWKLDLKQIKSEEA